MFYEFLLRGFSLVVGKIVGFRLRKLYKLAGGIAGDFLKSPVKTPDIVETAGRSNVCDTCRCAF